VICGGIVRDFRGQFIDDFAGQALAVWGDGQQAARVRGLLVAAKAA